MAKDTETVEEKPAEQEVEAEAKEPEAEAKEAEKPEAEAKDPEKEPEQAVADWREMLTDKEAKKAAERFHSLDDVFKSVSDLRKQISDRVKVPGKEADEKEVAKFRKALGVPEKPEGYELKLPEGVDLSEADEALVDAIRPVAHEQNIPAEAFNGFVAKFKEFETQIANEQKAQNEKALEAAESDLRQEWGKDYDANVNIANRAMSQLAGDELAEFIRKAELKDGGYVGDNPHLVRLFAKLGRRMSEDGAIEPVAADEAKDMEAEMDELTAKAHEARAKGDTATANRLFAKRSEIAARLEGDAPIVGGGGRAA